MPLVPQYNPNSVSDIFRAQNALALQNTALKQAQQQQQSEELSNALAQQLQPFKIQQAQAEAAASPLETQLKQIQIENLRKQFDPNFLNEQMQRKIQENNALYNLRPQLSVLQDPVTGGVSVVNRKTLEASPVNLAGTGSPMTITPQASMTEVSDAQGNKYKVRIDKAGNVLPGEPTLSEPARGNVVTDPITGQTSLVNPILPSGSQAGQAVTLTTNESSPKPFTVTPKGQEPSKVQDRINKLEPIKHFNEVQERADSIASLLDDAKSSGDYRVADAAINEELQRLISNQAIRGNSMNLLYKGQPVLDKVKGFFNSFTQGGNQYDDKTREDALNASNLLYDIAKKQRDEAIDAQRNAYPNKDLFDSQVGAAFPDYNPNASARVNRAVSTQNKLPVSGKTSSGISFSLVKPK